MRIFLINLLTTLLLCVNINAQKEIYFLHGSGGESLVDCTDVLAGTFPNCDEENSESVNFSSSWQIYDARYSTRTSVQNTRRIAYTSNMGIPTAGTTARAALDAIAPTSPPPSANNIAWGHSFGGLAIREMERNGVAGDFGGFITAGTTHNGAKMATSFANGDALEFLTEGCTEAGTDPVSASALLFPFPIPIFGVVGGFTGDLFCEGRIMNVFEGDGGAFTGEATINDLQPNSTAINNLNDFQSTKRIINVFGSENSPVHWRWLSSVLKPIDNSFITTPESRPAFLPLNSTEESPDALHNQILGIQELEGDLANLTAALGVAFVINPFTFHKAPAAFFTSAQWTQGENWLENSEAGWNDLIGATDDFVTFEVIETLQMTEPCQEMLLDADFGYPWFYETLTCEERECEWSE